MGKEYRTVKLEVGLIEELKKLKHPGQTLNGVIRELADTTVKLNETDKALGELLEKVKKDGKVCKTNTSS